MQTGNHNINCIINYCLSVYARLNHPVTFACIKIHIWLTLISQYLLRQWQQNKIKNKAQKLLLTLKAKL